MSRFPSVATRIDLVEAGRAVRRRWPQHLTTPPRGASVPADPADYSPAGPGVDGAGRRVVRRSPVHGAVRPAAIAWDFDDDITEVPAEPGGMPWLTIIPSLLGGAVIALLFSPLFMLFGLMSAGGLAARAIGAKVSYRRALRRRAEQLEEAAVAAALVRKRWRAVEVARRVDRALTPTKMADPWQHRLSSDGVLPLWYGCEKVSLAPVLGRDGIDAEVVGWLEKSVALGSVPSSVDLSVGEGLALLGDRADLMDSARFLVSAACTDFGPADLGLAILTTSDRLVDWDWAKWLPTSPAVAIIDATADSDAGVEVATLLAGIDGQRCLVVVDGVAATTPGPLAELLAGRLDGASLLWLNDGGDPPASCAASLRVYADLSGELRRGGAAVAVEVFGGDQEWAEAHTRTLAPLRDPEYRPQGSALPGSVDLGDLLAGERNWSEVIDHTWAHADRSSLPAMLALADEPVVVDLVADGPHGLVAGTTGSGKSELLRTMVASLAVAHPPELCSFVLVDFKGGGAFDVLDQIPHVTAVVTDLDGSAAARCLRGLRAELRHREERLRSEGHSDITTYALPDASDRAAGEGLGRLVIVVDEFAALASELPEFLEGLIDVARRGRSLGVHLVLATQRPAGVVTGEIRANTSLRIALRVQDKSDSLDVIDRPDAALLPSMPGRAVIVGGAGDAVTAQVASVTTPRQGISDDFVIHPAAATEAPESLGGVTALDEIVEALCDAANRRGGPIPKAPWNDEIADGNLDVLAALVSEPGAVVIGQLDDPDSRSQPPLVWRSADAGLMLLGQDGIQLDATVTVAVTQLGLSVQGPPAGDGAVGHVAVGDVAVPDAAVPDVAVPDVAIPDVIVLDGRHQLGSLADLPWVADVISGREPERLAVALERVGRDLVAGRDVRLVIHHWPAVIDGLTETLGHEATPKLTKLVREAVALGSHPIVTGSSDRDVPGRVADLLAQRFIHELSDPTAYLGFGIRPSQVPAISGNDVLEAGSSLVGKVGRTCEAMFARARAVRLPHPPGPVRVLGPTVKRVDMPSAVANERGPVIPLGLDRELSVVGLQLEPDVITMVVGHPGSGRSTTLDSIRAALEDAGLVEFALGGSVQDAAVELIDDGERMDAATAKERFAQAKEAGRPVVVAATLGSLRAFDGWASRLLSESRIVLLNPTRQDGEAVRVAVPDLSRDPVGRAVLIDRGRTRTLQVAC